MRAEKVLLAHGSHRGQGVWRRVYCLCRYYSAAKKRNGKKEKKGGGKQQTLKNPHTVSHRKRRKKKKRTLLLDAMQDSDQRTVVKVLRFQFPLLRNGIALYCIAGYTSSSAKTFSMHECICRRLDNIPGGSWTGGRRRGWFWFGASCGGFPFFCFFCLFFFGGGSGHLGGGGFCMSIVKAPRSALRPLVAQNASLVFRSIPGRIRGYRTRGGRGGVQN